MRIGIFIDSQALDEFVEQVRHGQARRDSSSAWAPQIFGLDALTALAVAGTRGPGHRLSGPRSSRPIPRHPMVLAIQALTTQAATGAG